MLAYLLVAVGGSVGATARYLLDRFVQSRHDSLFPWGTFSVNMIGSMILGALAGAALADAGSTLGLLLGIGFCGALTTYSTLSYETVRLIEQRARLLALANIFVSIVVGLGAVTIGYLAGSALLA